jgi:chemotaxis protein CheX
MVVKKYVLVVDAPGGGVARGASELKALGYEVAQVSDLAQALMAVSKLDRLSLVVVNCGTNSDGYEEFMASVRGLHPNLPVIWLGDACNVVAKFLKQPGASDRGLDLTALKFGAVKLLRDEFYRDDLVEEVVQAAHAVLQAFGVETTRSEPYIKSNLSALGDVNALLSFSGEGLSGHLMLSTSTENARTLQRSSAPNSPEPKYDDLEDLLGEIANRVLGSVKRVFESHSLSFKLRTPVFIRGPEARYRTKGSSPSLAIEFADNDGLLRMEFCVDRMQTDSLVRGDAEFLEAGQINFL